MSYQATDLAMTPADLTSLLAEPLPTSGLIKASAGEWRVADDGRWHFWQSSDWVGDASRLIPVFRENP
jgi:hypothetical protein